jgi:hypothetical protein
VGTDETRITRSNGRITTINYGCFPDDLPICEVATLPDRIYPFASSATGRHVRGDRRTCQFVERRYASDENVTAKSNEHAGMVTEMIRSLVLSLMDFH